MKTGIELIADERLRQISEEGWTPEHDDEHGDGSLAMAAACYAAPKQLYESVEKARCVIYQDPWPKSWLDRYDKRYTYESGNTLPPPNTYSESKRIDLLVKAGALIAAEIDRRQRLEITND